MENGQIPLLAFHQKRVDYTFQRYFPNTQPLDLQSILGEMYFSAKHKVRILYDKEVLKLEVHPYAKRTVNKIQLVEGGSISCLYKYADRSMLDQLYDQRGDADDVVIIKDGMVTDSTYANVALWDGSRWFTPSTYLLNGVKRQYLLSTGELTEREVRANDVQNFSKICLINAMLDLGEVELSTSQVLGPA